MKNILLTVVTVLAIVFGGVGAVALTSNNAPSNADCTAGVITETETTQNFDISCSVPRGTTTVTATVTTTVTATPTATPTVTPTSTPTPTNPPTLGTFPTAQTAGLPAGWTPTQTINGNFEVRTAGAVVKDLRVNGNILVYAKNVTIDRVEVNGSINNFPGSTCNSGMKITNSTINRAGNVGEGVISYGGYTADNIKINGSTEGFRVGAKSECPGVTTITNSWADVKPPTPCGDWHGDGLQGYDGGALVLKNSVLVLEDNNKSCYGTAPFFYPVNQGNTRADIDGLIVQGGGYPFRMGMPGTVNNLHIVNNSWVFGPIDVKCSALTSWQASISTLNASGQPVVVRAQPCNTNSGT